MPRYSIDGQDTNTATTTILGADSASATQARRFFVYDLILGSDATPADNAAEYELARFTVDGTFTAVTPQKMDAADAAALFTAGEAHSAEPTYTANAVMLQFATNQRATFRWVAAPMGEICVPATDDSGVGILVRTVAGSAINTNACMHILE